MIGLLIKDILVIAKQLKIFIFIIPIMVIAGGSSLATLAVMLGAVLPMTAIAYDERSRWNEIAVMMPYTKDELVKSKYFLGYVCALSAVILVISVQLISSLMGTGNLKESATVLLLAMSMGLIFIAINTPILFKFGAEKGRIVFIIAIGFVSALGTIVKDINVEYLFEMVEVWPFFLFIVAIVLNIISIFISTHIKLKY